MEAWLIKLRPPLFYGTLVLIIFVKNEGKMNRIICIVILIMTVTIGRALSQYNMNNSTIIRVMSYNVENLFDTINDPRHEDQDFTPDGSMQWNTARYHIKLQHISRVIARSGGWTWPDIITLIEVENITVLNDLIDRSPLKNVGYKALISHGLDRRGIHIGVLYKSDKVEILDKKEYQVSFPEDKDKLSRNILYFTFRVKGGTQIIHCFSCHLPSRREGEVASEPFRCDVARVLREKCDDLYRSNRAAKIIIMGDFNETPNDPAVRNILKAQVEQPNIVSDTLKLYNLFGLPKGESSGSYFYRGRWEQLDQIIISESLLDENSKAYYKQNSAHIYKADFLTRQYNHDTERIPYRTYQGPNYIAGYSDHFPVIADFIIQ